MRVAHLIMAHQNSIQLAKLVDRIRDPRFDIYIHLDSETDKTEFQHLSKLDGVFFIKNRKDVNWGGYSLVDAITASLREILSQKVMYDYINLLSGQDYPLKSSGQFFEFLKRNEGNSFISYDSSIDRAWWHHAVTRYEHYHFTDIRIKGRYRIQALLNRYMPKRKFPLKVELYGGSNSTWWTITNACAQYIVDFLDVNKKLIIFMKFTWGADEFLFTTIIMNSPFKHRAVNDNMRYIEWAEGKPRPRTLSIEKFDVLRESGCFFARKFDINEDSQILLLLDEFLSSSSGEDIRSLSEYPCSLILDRS